MSLCRLLRTWNFSSHTYIFFNSQLRQLLSLNEFVTLHHSPNAESIFCAWCNKFAPSLCRVCWHIYLSFIFFSSFYTLGPADNVFRCSGQLLTIVVGHLFARRSPLRPTRWFIWFLWVQYLYLRHLVCRLFCYEKCQINIKKFIPCLWKIIN